MTNFRSSTCTAKTHQSYRASKIQVTVMNYKNEIYTVYMGQSGCSCPLTYSHISLSAYTSSHIGHHLAVFVLPVVLAPGNAWGPYTAVCILIGMSV